MRVRPCLLLHLALLGALVFEIVGMTARMSWREPGVSNKIPRSVARAVRERDGDMCQLRYAGCTLDGEELDHVVPVARTGMGRQQVNRTITPDGLQVVCRACHRVKSQREAREGKNAWKRQREKHPGLLW